MNIEGKETENQEEETKIKEEDDFIEFFLRKCKIEEEKTTNYKTAHFGTNRTALAR